MAKDKSKNVWGQPTNSEVTLNVPLEAHRSRQGQNNPCAFASSNSVYANGFELTQGRCKSPSNAMKPFLKGGYGRHTRKSG